MDPLSGGTGSNGILEITTSGAGWGMSMNGIPLGISYCVTDSANRIITNGPLAIGTTKDIGLDAGTYTVKIFYPAQIPLTDPLIYHSCASWTPSGSMSRDRSTVIMADVQVADGKTNIEGIGCE